MRVFVLVLIALVATTARAQDTPTPPDVDFEAPENHDWDWLFDTLAVVRPTLVLEGDARFYPREAEGENGFALARLRTGLIIDPTPWLRGVATIEFAGSEGPSVLDAYAAFLPARWIEIRAGYSITPLFASFRYDPGDWTLAFPDRAPVVSAFRVFRDLGADVHVAPREVPIEAIVRIGDGSGSVLGNLTNSPAGYGAFDLVLGRAHVAASRGDEDFGLRVGVAGLVENVRDRQGISGVTPLGFVYYRPVTVSGQRMVGEAHVIAYAGPLRLTLEGALADESRSRDDDGNPNTPRVPLPSVRSYGMTAEVAVVVLGRPRVPGAAPRLAGDGGHWAGGAVEIAARLDSMWLGYASDTHPGGSLGGAASIRWWPVDFLTATVSAYVTRYDVAPIETPDQSWSYGGLLRLGLFWGQQPITR